LAQGELCDTSSAIQAMVDTVIDYGDRLTLKNVDLAVLAVSDFVLPTMVIEGSRSTGALKL
jgi:hypothetical protein